MPPPLAYFLTWTCKGTWLHGDERGSVDKNHNAPGTPLVDPSAPREAFERQNMTTDTLILSNEARRVVHAAIADHCEHRGWVLHAMNVRSNHVHVVVYCGPDVAPERAMTELKVWATRRLHELGIVPRHVRPWTRHGSTRWINDARSLDAALAYVVEGQDVEK